METLSLLMLLNCKQISYTEHLGDSGGIKANPRGIREPASFACHLIFTLKYDEVLLCVVN